jgi:hypothetical protein
MKYLPPTSLTLAAMLGLLPLSAAAAVHCVDINSTNATPPYTNWSTAALSIQDAVDAAVAGDEVVVADGWYDNGGRSRAGDSTPNRVAVTRPLNVRSLNGPQSTTIVGSLAYPPDPTRCVYLVSEANLSGFTLTGGYVPYTPNGLPYGGGAYGGTLNNCILEGNMVEGNFSYYPYLDGNGGGAYYSTLNNCTLIGNSAYAGVGFGGGGGAFGCTLNNCIVYGNTEPQYTYNSVLNHCCTPQPPAPPFGLGNITNAPLFADTNGWANLRLQSNSPCINAGNNSYITNSHFTNCSDLDGNPRIAGGTVDIGAYEFQSPASRISYAWLQQYGLPTDGSADFSDADGDGMNNWQEWRCGTDPTNALSALRLLAPVSAGTNLAVTWQSVAGVNYFLEHSTTFAPAFVLLATNIAGQSGTTSYTDTNARGNGQNFYRVGVGN